MINDPNNPTGVKFTKEECLDIIAVLSKPQFQHISTYTPIFPPCILFTLVPLLASFTPCLRVIFVLVSFAFPLMVNSVFSSFVVILSDEAYHDLVYSEMPHHLVSLAPPDLFRNRICTEYRLSSIFISSFPFFPPSHSSLFCSISLSLSIFFVIVSHFSSSPSLHFLHCLTLIIYRYRHVRLQDLPGITRNAPRPPLCS